MPLEPVTAVTEPGLAPVTARVTVTPETGAPPEVTVAVKVALPPTT